MKLNAVELLESLLNDVTGAESEVKQKPIEQQRTLLESFLEYTNRGVGQIKVGDYVQLSDWGKKKYRFPVSGQQALVLSVFDRPVLDRDAAVVHGEVGVIHHNGQLNIYAMDFRYMKKAP
jgi:hypothetical protein